MAEETHQGILGSLKGLQFLWGQRLELGQVAVLCMRKDPGEPGDRTCPSPGEHRGHQRQDENAAPSRVCHRRTASEGEVTGAERGTVGESPDGPILRDSPGFMVVSRVVDGWGPRRAPVVPPGFLVLLGVSGFSLSLQIRLWF
jgi:ribosomal protein S14